MKSLLVFSLVAALVGSSSQELTRTLSGVRNRETSEADVGHLIASLISKGTPTGLDQSIRDSFCLAARGMNCQDLQKVEEGQGPVSTYLSADRRLFCVVGVIQSGDGPNTWLYVFKKTDDTYTLATSALLLPSSSASSTELQTDASGFTIAVYGPRAGSNQSPLALVVVRIMASGQLRTLLSKADLLHGQVHVSAGLMTVSHINVNPDGSWSEASESYNFGDPAIRAFAK